MADINQVLLSRGQQGAPLLDLDFAGASFGSQGVIHPTMMSIPGLSFSRANPGYAKTSAGLLTFFSPNIPRITDMGILIEPAVTNLLIQSVAMESGNWSNDGASSVTNNGGLVPNGKAAARGLNETSAAANFHDTYQGVAVTPSTVYTFSVFVSENSRPRMQLKEVDSGQSVIFDLAGGVVASGTMVGGMAARTESYTSPDGRAWLRCQFTFETGPTQTSAIVAISSALEDNGTNYVGTVGLLTMLIWQAQLEINNNATSPIETTTVAAPRAADNMSAPGFPLPPVGSVIADVITPLNTPGFNNLVIASSDGSRGSLTIFNGSGDQAWSSYSLPGGPALNASPVGTPFARTKVAISWAPGTRSLAFGGHPAVTDASVVTYGDTTYIGQGQGYLFNSYIRRLKILPYQLSRAELQGMTR